MQRNGQVALTAEICQKAEVLISSADAYHECGHAFMAMSVGARVDHVTIAPDDDDGPKRYGDIQISWPLKRFSARALATAMTEVALAGPVAEMIYNDEIVHPARVPEWAHDWKQAVHTAQQMFPVQQQCLRYLESVLTKLHRVLSRDKNWELIATLADELEAHERLEFEELCELFNLDWLD